MKHIFLFLLFLSTDICLAQNSKLDFSGHWAFNDGYVNYTLDISKPVNGKYPVVMGAEGVQAFYQIKCFATLKDNTLSIYYLNVLDGILLNEKRIDKSKPILNLSGKGGKIISYWKQIYNNLETNGEGEVTFKKS
jgi:hypothetical protein